MIRVLIADDHTLMRTGLCVLLERTPDMRIVAEACDGREAIALVQEQLPDVVLMDVAMAGLNGLDATQSMIHKFPGLRVIMLSMHKHEAYVMRAMKIGASGYLLKDAAAGELEVAIRAVMAGEFYVSPALEQPLSEYFAQSDTRSAIHDELDQLTPREREVLQLIAEGHTMQEIGNRLGISVKTVETHRYRLMDKLNIHHITGLVRFAIRVGLVHDA